MDQPGRWPGGDSGITLGHGYDLSAETRALARTLGYVPVVPPNPQRLKPWRLNRRLYRRRNEVERLFRRLKGFRRVFTRFEKLDAMFMSFVHLALIFDALR